MSARCLRKSKRQSAGRRRANITNRRKGKKPNKEGLGKALYWKRTPHHRLLFGEQRVPLGEGEFLMAAGPASVCGEKGRNHHMTWRRDLGRFVCINRGCPANC